MQDFQAGMMIDQHPKAYNLVEQLFIEAHPGERRPCGRRALRAGNTPCPTEAEYTSDGKGNLKKPANRPSAPTKPCVTCASIPYQDKEAAIADRVRARCEPRLVSDFKEKG